MGDDTMDLDPHATSPALSAGPSPQRAKAVLILLHGRGGLAEGMLDLFRQLDVAGVGAIAPQAAGRTWYPQSFLAPIEQNQPLLDSALRRVETLVADLLARGLHSEHIAVLGFSQGACLALEHAWRNPRRYGAIIGLTGGLIGPPGTRWSTQGDFGGTSVLLGAGDPDPHVPFARVEQTAQVLASMGAKVDLRRYPGMGHTINDEEFEACRAMLRAMV